MQSPRVFFSNQYEALSDLLKENLYVKGLSPLQKKLVIVPSRRVKNDLYLRFIEQNHVSVVAGVKFLTLDQAVIYLSELLIEREMKLPSKQILALHLEKEILELKDEELLNYLDGESRVLRARGLAWQLSEDFINYGTFGGAFLPSWLKRQGWQQVLFQNVFRFWNYPYQLLEKKIEFDKIPFTIDLHLFGIHFLPNLYQEFFGQFLGKWSFTAYHFSPCRFYWEDLATRFEKKMLARSSRNASIAQQEDLSNYLEEQNPLLANFGKLGRTSLPFYDSFLSTDQYIEKGGSQLEMLQKALLDLETEKFSANKDDSIQLHAFPSKYRELLELKKHLIEILQTENVLPKDILVLAPNISEYAELIHLVFGSLDEKICYQIHGLEVKSHFLQGTRQLLSLIGSVWNAEDILKLFGNPLFLKRHGWKGKDYHQIRHWFIKANIRFGYDLEHRKSHSSKERKNEEVGLGTFSDAITRMLLGLVSNSDEGIQVLDMPSSELFGEVVECLESLKYDLEQFETKEHTFKKWLHLMKEWTYKHFTKEEAKSCALFDAEIANLALLPEFKGDFSSIKTYLEKALTKNIDVYAPSEVESIRFSTISPGEVIPAKILCMIGMDEQSFPKKSSVRALSEMKSSPLKDPFPTTSLKDRYLFLEALLSCRKTLILSYTNLCKQTGKELGPSSLIDELVYYLGDVNTFTHFIEKSHKKSSQSSLIPSFSFPEEVCFEENVIDLREIKKLATSPLRFYCNKALGLYLKRGEVQGGDMILSYLQKAIFRIDAMKNPLENVLKHAEVHGKLPSGPLNKIAISRVEEEMHLLWLQLASFDVKREDIYQVELSAYSEKPHIEGNVRFHKALTINGKILVGSLDNVCSKGLIFHGEKKAADLIKIWPLYLVFLSIQTGDLLLTKKGERLSPPKGDPLEHLATYLEYFEKASTSPSPLEPDWALPLLKKEEKTLLKLLSLKDEYFTFAFQEKAHMDGPGMMKNWTPYLEKAFEPFLTWSAS